MIYLSKYHLPNAFPLLNFATEEGTRRQSLDEERIHSNNGAFNGDNGNDSSKLGHRFDETDSAKRRGSNSSVDSRLVNTFSKV